MVSNGNVTGILDRLVGDKIVVRQAPADDRRAIIVRLTPRGLKQFTAMAKAHETWVDGLLSEFDAGEADTLIRQLDGVSSPIPNGAARAAPSETSSRNISTGRPRTALM